jgi:hypothetical protein
MKKMATEDNLQEGKDKSIVSKDERIRWTANFLIDCLKQELALVRETLTNNEGKIVESSKYYDWAFQLQKLGVVKPTPTFVINAADLSTPLLKELNDLDPYTMYYVLHQAVGRIFEDINFELFHNSISRMLKVKLV